MARAHSCSRDIVSIATLPQGASVTRRRSQKSSSQNALLKTTLPGVEPGIASVVILLFGWDQFVK
jgi:hypothetical protein